MHFKLFISVLSIERTAYNKDAKKIMLFLTRLEQNAHKCDNFIKPV